MSETPSPHQPPSGEPAPRRCLAASAFGIAAVLLGGVVAHQRAEAAHARPLPPPAHIQAPAAGPPACRPPDGCAPPATTRPRAPATAQASGTGPDCRSWACSEINSGIENGYLPDDYNPDEDAGAEDLLEIVERYGEHNTDFDADAAIETLPEEGTADRGDMFIAIATGIGVDVEPGADPFEVADELADMGILLGHDGDGDGITNPYTRPDADPDSTMSNAQLAALLDRIRGGDEDGGGGGVSPPPRGDDDDPCTTGLRLTAGERSRFVSQMRWVTLVGIEARSRPGRPWPPHPDVPGGGEHLLVARSPVWPVADSQGVWSVAGADGCLWDVVSIRTRMTQQLPWRPSHRAAIENAGAARPGAGFDAYLSRWDNLSAAERAQAERRHRNLDVNASCGIATAMAAADSYDRCRWELATPGVWSWQTGACFEGTGEGGATFRRCATLAGGVEWFLGIIDYTSATTLQGDPVGSGPERPHPSPAG